MSTVRRLLLVLLTLILTRHHFHVQATKCEQWSGPRLGDGCDHVYLDMGTNVGLQIRKLYEPDLYPNNPTENIFLKYFGRFRSGVCAFGFEANPIHTDRLHKLQRAYRELGLRVYIFTETAVSTRNGNTTFFRDPGASKHNEWGAGLTLNTLASTSKLSNISVTVAMIDIVCFLRNHVILRSRPRSDVHSSIVIKSDIEGHDVSVLSHLVASGMWCHVSAIYGEHVSTEWVRAVALALQHVPTCSTKYYALDDETGNDSLPLPSSSYIK